MNLRRKTIGEARGRKHRTARSLIKSMMENAATEPIKTKRLSKDDPDNSEFFQDVERRIGIVGGIARKVTEDYQISVQDGVVGVDATSRAINVTLPKFAETPEGMHIYFKRLDAGSNVVTILSDDNTKVDGAIGGVVLTATQYSVTSVAKGVGEWWRVGS